MADTTERERACRIYAFEYCYVRSGDLTAECSACGMLCTHDIPHDPWCLCSALAGHCGVDMCHTYIWYWNWHWYYRYYRY